MIATTISSKEFYNLLPDTYEVLQALKGDFDDICLSAVVEYYEETFNKKFPLEIVEIPVFSSKRKSRKNICSKYYVVGVRWESIPSDATKAQIESYIKHHLKESWKIADCSLKDIDIPLKDSNKKIWRLFMDYTDSYYVADCFREWLDNYIIYL